MRRRGDATSASWPVPARAVAIVGLTMGLAACGAHAVRTTSTAATSTSTHTRVALRQTATGGPVAAEVELDCTTPVASSGGHGGVAIASSTAQRWSANAAPGRDWTAVVDVPAGATCTATDRPVPPAALRSVTGGTATYDGATLTGVATTLAPGTTAQLTFLVGATA